MGFGGLAYSKGGAAPDRQGIFGRAGLFREDANRGFAQVSARFYFNGNPIHDCCVESMLQGCPYRAEQANLTDYRPSDVAVMFGTFKKKVPVSWPRGEILRKQKEAGLKTIVLDSGYIHRGDGPNHYYSVGFDGLNGRADFRNEDMPQDRLDRLGIVMQPWRKGGSHILLCGQVPWDASVQNVDVLKWLVDAVDHIRSKTDRKIVYRPHPKAREHSPPIPGTDYSLKPLEDDLADCWAVVTYNSNTGVDAALLGRPVFAFDRGSMALPIANTKWADLARPSKPCRQQWAANLAYAQWTPQEMKEGKPWQHLFRK